MRISDWSSDVCSSDLGRSGAILEPLVNLLREGVMAAARLHARACPRADRTGDTPVPVLGPVIPVACWVHVRRKFHDVYAARQGPVVQEALEQIRSEEHTSELQSLMRISYAVFCLKKKKQTT